MARRRSCSTPAQANGASTNGAAPARSTPQAINVDALPAVISDDCDPKLLERLRLAQACKPRQRLYVEIYVMTKSKKAACEGAGYLHKKPSDLFWRLMGLPNVRAYWEYMEGILLTEPDAIWCMEKLVAIVRDPKSPAAARVSAIERIGRMKKVPGLCDVEQEKGGTNVVVPVKVFIGIDPEAV